MSHPVDFVGLNRFIYDINGWDIDDKTLNPFYGTSDNTGLGQEIKVINGAGTAIYVDQNHIGSFSEPERLFATVLYKNEQYPASLSDLPTYFTALTLHRNGPYGYSSWQQTRASHNPLSRRQRKHNVFTYYEEPGELIDKKDLTGKRIVQKPRRSKIIKKIEQPLSQKYKPLELGMGIAPDDQDFGKCNDITLTMKSSHGNEVNFFDHLSVAKYYDKDLDTSDNYENIKALYLDGALDSEASPLQSFRFLRYAETIYPSTRNVYRNHTRMRQEYVFRWSDEIKERIEPGISLKNDPLFSLPGAIDNGFKFEVPYQSKWNIDAGWNFEIFTGERDYLFEPAIQFGAIDDYLRESPVRKSIAISSKFTWPIGGSAMLNNTYAPYNYSYDETTPTGKNTAGGEGQLQNSYCLFADFRQLSNSSGYTENIDKVLSASCLYNRRHVIPSYHGLVSPSGMFIEELEQRKSQNPIQFIDIYESFGGVTKWQVGETRKIFDKNGKLVSAPVNPFYETYDKFSEHTKIVGKDYSLVPEFKISDHVETYEKIGLTEQNLKLFDVLGGLSGSEDSSKEKFYQVYSNSDFMEHFEVIKDDHKYFAEPSMITLQCKAVKKFLPYDGFYPNQRTEALGKQFIKSYSDHFRVVECRTYEIDDPTELLPNPMVVKYKFFTKVFASASLDLDQINYQLDNEGDFAGSVTLGTFKNVFNYGTNTNAPTTPNLRGDYSPSRFDTNGHATGGHGVQVLFYQKPEINSEQSLNPTFEGHDWVGVGALSTHAAHAARLIALGSHGKADTKGIVRETQSFMGNTGNGNWKDYSAGTLIVNDVNNNIVAFMIIPSAHWDTGGNRSVNVQSTIDSKVAFSGSWDPNYYSSTSKVSRDYYFPSSTRTTIGMQNGGNPINDFNIGSDIEKAASIQMVWQVSNISDPFFGDMSTDAGIRKFEQRDSFSGATSTQYAQAREFESTVALPIVFIRGGTAERTAKAFADAINAINAASAEDGSAASAVHNCWKTQSDQGGWPATYASGFEARAGATEDADGNWSVTVESTDASAIHAAEEYKGIPCSTCTGVVVSTTDTDGLLQEPQGVTNRNYSTQYKSGTFADPVFNTNILFYTESNLPNTDTSKYEKGIWTTSSPNQLKPKNIHECSEDSLYPKIQPIVTPLLY